MILYLIRHAPAVPLSAEDANEELDSQRPLSTKGRQQMRRIAKGLKALEISIDQIVTSPYLRARQTAAILAKRFELNDDRLAESALLEPGADLPQLIQELHEKYAEIQNLALVGHEPSLSHLLSVLVSGEPSMAIRLRKGSVCRLAVDDLKFGQCATLEWHLTPSQLEDLGR